MARPAQFDRDRVLDKAMQAFWEHGYCATSMADLVETTKLKPGSLYAAFESKQGLFLATLDRYGANSADKLRQHLKKADSPLRAIEEYLDQLVDIIESRSEQNSCFLVNTVLELSRRDVEVREHINKHFAEIESIFLTALNKAQEKDELGSDVDCEALAAFLMNNIWGLRVLAGTHPNPGRARQVAGLVKQILMK
jgi:TetR/AcrR family transcriptional regulator, transcriptional repressor for nem operon